MEVLRLSVGIRVAEHPVVVRRRRRRHPADARGAGGAPEGLPSVRVDAVYASDLARAHETAQIVATRLGLPLTTLRELREKHFGTWEGLTDEEVLTRFPRAREGPWGDGETSEELSQRVLAAVRRIATEHPDGHVLVVSHGGPLRALLRHCAVEANGRIPNCHVLRLEVEDGVFRPVD